MRARLRALVVVALASLGFAACTGGDLELGGAPPAQTTTTAATTWGAQPDVTCPWTQPVPRDPCDTRDTNGDRASSVCRYVDLRGGCPVDCACGVDDDPDTQGKGLGRWACFIASCGVVVSDGCREGSSCADGVGCEADGARCVCSDDGTLHCEKQPPAVQ
jgi:hypothetical protein